jgi:hypothetical protein
MLQAGRVITMKWRGWIVLGAVPIVLVAYVGYAASQPVSPTPDVRPAARGADCRLLAQMLRSQSLPLMPTSDGPACVWSRYGLENRTITKAQFEAACRRTANGTCSGRYLPHVSLRSPRYSPYRLHAEVDVGTMYDWDAASGERCGFVNLGGGWLPVSCRATWIS